LLWSLEYTAKLATTATVTSATAAIATEVPPLPPSALLAPEPELAEEPAVGVAVVGATVGASVVHAVASPRIGTKPSRHWQV